MQILVMNVGLCGLDAASVSALFLSSSHGQNILCHPDRVGTPISSGYLRQKSLDLHFPMLVCSLHVRQRCSSMKHKNLGFQL